MLSVRPYRGSDRSVWDDFVRSSKNGTFLFLRDYMDYHADRFADASILVMDRQERVAALLPANRLGDTIVSHGGLTYGGLVLGFSATTGQVLDIVEAVIAYFSRIGIAEMIYKTIPSIYHRAPAEEDKYALFYFGAELYRREVLSVTDLETQVAFQERRRRGVQRAAGRGLRVTRNRDLHIFWPILEENLWQRHKLRPVHALAEMQLLEGRFADNISLHTVVDDQATYAGALLYHAGPVVHVQYTAASEQGRLWGAPDLLFASLIDMFRGQRRYFDFGNSNENEGRYLNRGLADFKEGFGARAICHDFYRLRIAGPMADSAAAVLE